MSPGLYGLCLIKDLLASGPSMFVKINQLPPNHIPPPWAFRRKDTTRGREKTGNKQSIEEFYQSRINQRETG
jgi:hypothetical protein